jgi:hypothetical protein
MRRMGTQCGMRRIYRPVGSASQHALNNWMQRIQDEFPRSLRLPAAHGNQKKIIRVNLRKSAALCSFFASSSFLSLILCNDLLCYVHSHAKCVIGVRVFF